ncbi:MAG: low temperature requirement protein, partial [Schumannella sp.]|nr:low temperature requirement protein [Schumannella sp.]
MSTGHVRMRARRSDEEHRAATPFELLFDLVFVVAVASLVTQFAHAIVHGDLATHIGPFLMVFFAIWWAWVNFTWFSSGYDTGDVIYRLLGTVQMGGVLVLASGVPAAFERTDYVLITAGYAIMRVAMVALWVRAAVEHPATRSASATYAIGISIVQVLWLVRLLLPPEVQVASFVVLVLAEFSVPVLANRLGDDPWHPGHIAERYGLFMIILLGEGVLAASNGVQAALAAAGGSVPLVVVGAAGFLILVGLWWLYFLEPAEEGLAHNRRLSFYWGYGHVFLFAAVAAVGAGLEVAVQVVSHHTAVPDVTAGLVVAVPVALVLVLVWVLHRPLVVHQVVTGIAVLPAATLMIAAALAAPVLTVAGVVVAVAVLTAVAVTITLLRQRVAK